MCIYNYHLFCELLLINHKTYFGIALLTPLLTNGFNGLIQHRTPLI